VGWLDDFFPDLRASLSSGNHMSPIQKSMPVGNRKLDPVAWILGDRYTNAFDKFHTKSNEYLSKGLRPFVEFDKQYNPLRQVTKEIGPLATAERWAEQKPTDAIALTLAAIYGGGALASAGGTGGTAGAGAGTATGAGSSAPWGFGPGMSFEAVAPSLPGVATQGINPVVSGFGASSAPALGAKQIVGIAGGLGGMFGGGWQTPGINGSVGPYGRPPVTGGIFSDKPTSPVAAALLASSGSSTPPPMTNADAVSRALMAVEQSKALALKQLQDRDEAEQRARYREAQIAEMERQGIPVEPA